MNDLYLLAIFTAVAFCCSWYVDSRRQNRGLEIKRKLL